MDFKKMSAGAAIGKILYTVGKWFATAALIWWGWNIFAWHFDLPQFEYMEIFAMRMALTCIMKIFIIKMTLKVRATSH